MNEELKIIIRAITDEAQKNMAAVRKELEAINDESTESGKAVDAAMAGMAKGVAAAVAAVAALTTAMAALGRQAQDVNKGFEKLNTTFLNAGTTTAQASQTYKELFSFLGEHDKAVETAQSLALITSEEQKLSEWTHILQGAFAEMGDKLPIEGLAEAANETMNVGQVVGVMADALNWAGISEDAFNQALAQTSSLEEREALIRSTLNGLYGNSAKIYDANSQATKRYNESQADLNIALATAASYTTPLLTALNELSTTMLTSFGPALQTIAIYLTAFIQLIAEAITWVANFFGVFSNSTDGVTADFEGYRKAVEDYQNQLRNAFKDSNKELKDEEKNIEKIKKATMGFDELNILPSQTASAAPGGDKDNGPSLNLPTAPNPSDFGIGAGALDMSAMTDAIAEAKEYLKGALVLIGMIGAGILAWKVGEVIADFKQLKSGIKVVEALVKKVGEEGFKKTFGKSSKEVLDKANEALDTMKQKWMTVGGTVMAAVGAMMLIVGFSDAWVNGLDLQNIILMIGGIALAVGGIAMAFGPVAAAIAAFVGGISLIVIGIKDMVTNGATLENVLTLIAGAITLVIGALILMGKENIKAVAGWIAHTAAVVAQKVATAAMTIAQTALNLVMNMSPLGWIITAIVAVVAAFVLLWNNCEGFRNFWIDLWEGIKSVFAAVVDWIKNAFNAVVNFFKENWQALLLLLVNPFAGAFKLLYDNCDGFREFIDKWVAKIGKFFKDLWEGIKKTFSGIGKWFSDVFTAAWNGIKKAFSAVGSFFTGIWDKIKSIFSKVGTAIADAVSGAFKKAINWVLEKAISIINGFIKAINIAISVINAIPGVSITKLTLLEVPKLAKGGITNGSTLANIGEAGREAVLPLENNTDWMDTLADRIAARNNAPSRIVLQVDGKELGYATINSINGITRQTGTLQLAII